MKRSIAFPMFEGEGAPAGGGAAAAPTTADGDKGGAPAPTAEETAAKAAADAAAAAAAGKTGEEGKDGVKPEGSKDGAAPAAPKAPEKYTLAIPDAGKTMLDATDVTKLEKLFREANLTNEQAQEALNDHAASLAAQSGQFLTDTKADPIFGGANFEVTQRDVDRAIEQFAPAGDKYGDALRSVLTKTGYKNSLPIVAMLARIGKAMAEDTPGAGGLSGKGKGSETKKDIASTLYDNPTSKL